MAIITEEPETTVSRDNRLVGLSASTQADVCSPNLNHHFPTSKASSPTHLFLHNKSDLPHLSHPSPSSSSSISPKSSIATRSSALPAPRIIPALQPPRNL